MLLILGACLLLTLLYMIYYPPSLLITYLQARHPAVLFHLPLPPSHRLLALTVDDVPSQHTGALLDILKKHNARATFFTIGDQVPGYEAVLQRIHREGHELGNHAWSDEKTIFRPLHEIEAQIHAVEALLPANASGRRYFRPGGGFFTSAMVKHVTGMGYRVVLGCIYPHDAFPFFLRSWSAWINARHVVGMARPGGIVIVHDRRGHSVEQLELMLFGLKGGGWAVTSLGGLLDAFEDEGAGRREHNR